MERFLEELHASYGGAGSWAVGAGVSPADLDRMRAALLERRLDGPPPPPSFAGLTPGAAMAAMAMGWRMVSSHGAQPGGSKEAVMSQVAEVAIIAWRPGWWLDRLRRGAGLEDGPEGAEVAGPAVGRHADGDVQARARHGGLRLVRRLPHVTGGRCPGENRESAGGDVVAPRPVVARERSRGGGQDRRRQRHPGRRAPPSRSATFAIRLGVTIRC